MTKAKMILMTKSYKHKKYCVAGFNIENGQWIRLVSSKDQNNAIDMFVLDKFPKKDCLDIIGVNLIENVPLFNQKENYLIDETEEITRLGRVNLKDILNEVYLNKCHYIFGGTSRFITEDEAEDIGYSLVFVQVQNLVIHCFFDDNLQRWKNKCSFEYKGNYYYDISLTDPEYRHEKYNDVLFREAAIVVSLPSEPFYDGKFYKFVAKVFVIDGNE